MANTLTTLQSLSDGLSGGDKTLDLIVIGAFLIALFSYGALSAMTRGDRSPFDDL